MCGIFAAYSYEEDVSSHVLPALGSMQHRGEQSCGYATMQKGLDCSKPVLNKRIGLVNGLGQPTKGDVAIGHVRYSTSGAESTKEVQPIRADFNNYSFVFAFNGQINNPTGVGGDSEVLKQMLLREVSGGKDFYGAFMQVKDSLEGAYSLCGFDNHGQLLVSRDPSGRRPLFMAVREKQYFFASESSTLEMFGLKPFEFDPGLTYYLQPLGLSSNRSYASVRKCFFEGVYFSSAASRLNDKRVYKIRYELGERLSLREEAEGDIVVPVPDTSRPAASGFARCLDLPCAELVRINRFSGRSFTKDSERQKCLSTKYTVLGEFLDDQRVFLVDDSIVRGNTIKKVVESIRKVSKPKSIHVRVTCPPIVSPCTYGVDIKTREELIRTHKKTDEELAEHFDVDSVRYLTEEDITGAMGDNLCFSCVRKSNE